MYLSIQMRQVSYVKIENKIIKEHLIYFELFQMISDYSSDEDSSSRDKYVVVNDTIDLNYYYKKVNWKAWSIKENKLLLKKAKCNRPDYVNVIIAQNSLIMLKMVINQSKNNIESIYYLPNEIWKIIELEIIEYIYKVIPHDWIYKASFYTWHNINYLVSRHDNAIYNGTKASQSKKVIKIYRKYGHYNTYIDKFKEIRYVNDNILKNQYKNSKMKRKIEYRKQYNIY